MEESPNKTSDERFARKEGKYGVFEKLVPAAVLPDGWAWRFKYNIIDETRPEPWRHYTFGDAQLLTPKGTVFGSARRRLPITPDEVAVVDLDRQNAPDAAGVEALFFGPFERSVLSGDLDLERTLLGYELSVAAEKTGIAPGNEKALEAFARYACMEAARKIVAEAELTVKYYENGEIESPAQAAETVAEQLGASNLAKGLARACGREVAAAIKGTLEGGAELNDIVEAITETCLEFSQTGLGEPDAAELLGVADALRTGLEGDREPVDEPGKDREERGI